ncbi:hypothetical protein F8S13_17045 [Chloroflexia bacterium SDU3-3]|nr:hypothetical protein F8S13_17045 [Chloroflexia bacterium SDU3-3]
MTTRTSAGVRRLIAALAILLLGMSFAPPTYASGTKLTHAQATAKLSAAGITWSSSGGCSNRNNATCTSFEQINSGTIDSIIVFKNASGCAVNITGGTETGHASGTYSHWNGYKVDISISTCVNNWITSAYTYIGVRSDGAAMYQSAAGNIYAREGSHWDILYY